MSSVLKTKARAKTPAHALRKDQSFAHGFIPAPSLLPFLERSIQRAARGLRRDLGELDHLDGGSQGRARFVIRARDASRRRLEAELAQAQKQRLCWSTDQSPPPAAGTKSYFVLDPLVGCAHVQHGPAPVALAIALVEGAWVSAAVIFDPQRDELFSASRGRGATMNRRRLRLVGKRDVAHAVLACSTPEDEALAPFIASLRPRLGGLRSFGDALLDLAALATGRVAAVLIPHAHARMSAGLLMAWEAGALISHLDGKKIALGNPTPVLASAPAIHRALLHQLPAATGAES